jgi:hypothetical protein
MKKMRKNKREKMIVDFKIDGIEYSVFTNKDGVCTGMIFNTQVGFVNEFELKNIKYDFLDGKSNDFIKKVLLDNRGS